MEPEESLSAEEAHRERIEALRAFRSHKGYGVLCEIIQWEFARCVREKLNNSPDKDQLQVDADMRAWDKIRSVIDYQITSYDQDVYSKLQQQKQQQGGHHAH